jgi:hypothetical protein
MKWKYDCLSMTVWRGRSKIAQVGILPNGKFRWDGLEMFRENFSSVDLVLEDVKYFHRYPQKRATTITFSSGRKLVL